MLINSMQPMDIVETGHAYSHTSVAHAQVPRAFALLNRSYVASPRQRSSSARGRRRAVAAVLRQRMLSRRAQQCVHVSSLHSEGVYPAAKVLTERRGGVHGDIGSSLVAMQITQAFAADGAMISTNVRSHA